MADADKGKINKPGQYVSVYQKCLCSFITSTKVEVINVMKCKQFLKMIWPLLYITNVGHKRCTVMASLA